MSNDYAFTDGERFVAVNVQTTVVLDVAALPDSNRVHIPSNRRVAPNAHLVTEFDIADHLCARIYVSRFRERGESAPIRTNHGDRTRRATQGPRRNQSRCGGVAG